MGLGMVMTSVLIITTVNIMIVVLKHLNDKAKAIIEIIAQVCFLAMLLYWVYALT